MVAELVRPRVIERFEPSQGNRSEHRRAPMLEALDRYRAAQTANFATPGHKLGVGTDPALRTLLGADVFAADVWLPPAELDAARGAAEALAADAWGAEQALFVPHGASGGNHGLLLGTLRPGDEVVVARDVHKSVLVALILTGARPVWVGPRLHPELNLGLGAAAADIAAALAAHPAARLVIVSSPSYWGVAADLPALVAEAHARAVPIYVDEAWGPHFPFHPDLPTSAMAAGADAAVTSPHKLLASLNQGALLLLRGGLLERERVAGAVRMAQTTSPFLPFFASLDACRRQMVLQGGGLLDRAIALAEDARRRLRGIPGLAVLGPDNLRGAAGIDPTKLVIDVRGLGVTGFVAEQALRCSAIVPAMADLGGVVCFVTVGDDQAAVDRLVAAFAELARGRKPALLVEPPARTAGSAVGPGTQAMTPREAFFAPSRALPLATSLGEVAAELVIPYPPGIPVLAPGEIICADKLAYLRAGAAAGMTFRGPADPSLATIRVVA